MIDEGDDTMRERAEHDDFSLIKGLSPKLAARLHRAGVLTYAKLAQLTPEEILARLGPGAGLNTDSIARRNWAGQAAELAAGRREDSTLDRGKHAESYVVELYLDGTNRISRTKVHHTGSGDEECWEDWDDGRLIHFFSRRQELRMASPPRESGAGSAAAAVENPPIGIKLSGIEFISAEACGPSLTLEHGRPFGVQVSLDAREALDRGQDEIEYSARVQARALGSGEVHLICDSIGTLRPGESMRIESAAACPPPGLYRVAAHLAFSRPGDATASHAGICPGEGILEVY